MARLPSITDLVSWIKGIERRVSKLETAPRLGNTSIGADGLRFYDGGSATFEDGGGIKIGGGGGIEVTGGDISILAGGGVELAGGDIYVRSGGDVIVDPEGQMRSSNFVAGASGWRMLGDLLEVNDILLRGGIIGNDALASPVATASASQIENGFGTATTDQARAAVSIPVPSGFSQALVLAFGAVMCINSTATNDNLYGAVQIEGVKSRELPVNVQPSGFAPVSTAKSQLLTGLSGGSVDLSMLVHTQEAAWAAHVSNRAFVEAQVLFLR